MKKSISCALSLLTAAVAIADPLELMNNVHEEADSAAKDFNSAVAKELSADSILRENGRYATDTLSNAIALKNRHEALSRALQADKNAVERLKVAYAASEDLLKTSKGNLDILLENLPMGDALIKIGREIAVKGRELTAKNPGANYQDQNYFQQVINRFDRAVVSFNSLKDEASGLSVKMSVSKSMMAGISATIGMTESYLQKLSDAIDGNANGVDGVFEAAESFYKSYAGAYGEMSKRAESARAVRYDIIALFTKISAVEVNGFGQNEAYANAAFKYARPLSISKVLYPVQQQAAPVFPKEKLASIDAGINGYSLDRSMSLSIRPQAAAQNTAFAQPDDQEESYEKKLRGEILNLALNLDNIANRLNRAVSVIQYLAADANDALDSVSANETESQNLLRNVISDFGESQSLASEIQILAASNEVGKMREKISSDEMAKLFTEASGLFEKSSETVKSASEKLSEVERELK